MMKMVSLMKTALWMAMIALMLSVSSAQAQADLPSIRLPRFGVPQGALDSPGGDVPPSGSLDTLEDLKKAVVALQAQAKTQQMTIKSLEAKLAAVSVSGNDFTISGKNVRIVDGSGATKSTSGLGNLTVGYNELRKSNNKELGNTNNIRTGSHNIILGTLNNYVGYGGFVAGSYNNISAPFASVSGGFANTASGLLSSVSGGRLNQAKGQYSSVSGGFLRGTVGPDPDPDDPNSPATIGEYDWIAGGLFQDF